MSILILEDEAYLIKLMKSVLVREFEVLEASTAQEAILRFQENPNAVQLLIADLTLPVSSGVQVARYLRQQSSGLPVLLTSGYPKAFWSEQQMSDLHWLGPHSLVILQKPFPARDLRESVRKLVRPKLAAHAQTA
jgi:two-component system, cell cycle sensor histidine kinase and response regulator CckA